MKNKRKPVIIVAVCVIALVATALFIFQNGNGNTINTGLWFKNIPDEKTVKSALWELDKEKLGEDAVILSISPTGKYILTADPVEQDLTGQPLIGENTHEGALYCISLYEKQNGAYTRTSRIDIDTDANPELKDTLATCCEDGVAWSDDESRVILAAGTPLVLTYTKSANADVLLVDFTEGSVKNLTNRNAESESKRNDIPDLLPKWNGKNSVCLIRHLFDENGMNINLMSIDIITGEQRVEADLSLDGYGAFVDDYVIFNDMVYYIVDGGSPELTGLYMAALDGKSSTPTLLLNLSELQEDNIHPYFLMFLSVQISSDGRWLCLEVDDKRFLNSDIPLADHHIFPQPDPSLAKSITGEKWIPCHNVMLYDLKNNERVDPFINEALQPDVVIATAAAFAPDGKSLLCAVFGDGGPWTTKSFDTTTLYHIRLDNSTFDAVRIYTTEVGFQPIYLSWHGNNSIRMRARPVRDIDSMALIIPAAFEQFAGKE